jgi:hypothetical protein
MGSSSAGASEGSRPSSVPKKQNVVQRVVSKTVDYVKGGGLIGAGIRAAERYNKRNRQNLMDYEGQAAGITPMRSPNYNRGNNSGGESENRQPVATNVGGTIVKVPSPTTSEISQSNATDVTYDERKTKSKGRSMTILTSAKGVRKDNELILGKKSLLGRA